MCRFESGERVGEPGVGRKEVMVGCWLVAFLFEEFGV